MKTQIAVVFCLAGIVLCLGGCVTVPGTGNFTVSDASHPGLERPKGEVPKVGDIIDVLQDVQVDMSGSHWSVVVWRHEGQSGAPHVWMTHEYFFTGLKGPGKYTVVMDVEVFIGLRKKAAGQ